VKSIKHGKGRIKKRNRAKGNGNEGIFFSIHLNVAKAEDAADPRRQGRSGTKVPRSLDHTGDAASNGFPEG